MARLGRPFPCLVLAMAVLLAHGHGIPARADDAWRARVEAELAKVEAGLEAIDSQARATGSLLARATQVHERLLLLEREAALEAGKIAAKDDLAALTQDVVVLKSRLGAVVAARAGPNAAPKPKPKPKEDKPKPPDEKKWPESLEFKATANVNYIERGEWFIDEVHRSGLGNDFLQDGYEGSLSFSVRAGGLLREIKEAKLRVAVKIDEPFTREQGLYRVYEVTWSAQRTLWNDALKTWNGHDTISVNGPVRWIARPVKQSKKLDAKAYVLSVITKDGQKVEFVAPEFTPR